MSSCRAIFETVTEITHPILHLYVTMLKMDVKGMNGWRTIVSTSNEEYKIELVILHHYHVFILFELKVNEEMSR